MKITLTAAQAAPARKGRKPSPTGPAKPARINMRAATDDHAAWKAAAEAAGLSLTDWMTQACNRTARKT